MGKKSHGIFSKSLGEKSKKNPMGLKNPGISGKSKKNPKDEKMSKNEKKIPKKHVRGGAIVY